MTTLTDRGVRCGNHGGETVHHASAAEVRACFFTAKPAEPVACPPAAKPDANRVQYLQRLLAERDVPTRYLHSLVDYLSRSGRAFPASLQPTQAGIEAAIARVETMPERRGSAPARKRIELDGMYRTSDGTIFKVQKAVHGSGHLYAKALVVEYEGMRDEAGRIVSPAKISFRYVPGAVARLSAEDRMTIEQCKEFGALYGTCVRCGRTLTLEESIERMMGAVCAGKQAGR